MKLIALLYVKNIVFPYKVMKSYFVSRKKKMVRTVVFLYGIVLFLILFLVGIEGEGKPFFIAASTNCEDDANCPQNFGLYPFIYKCIDNSCKLTKVQPYIE